MIKNIPKEVLYPVREESLFYIDNENGWAEGLRVETPVKAIVVEAENSPEIAGIVSKNKYNLVSNREILETVSNATESLGLDYEFDPGLYKLDSSGYTTHKYYMKLVSQDSSFETKIGEDQSTYKSVIEVINGYDGSTRVQINSSGSYEKKRKEIFFYVIRQICSNGMRGRVRVEPHEFVNGEQVFVGSNWVQTESERIVDPNIMRKTHSANINMEAIKHKIEESFKNNKIVQELINRTYEKAIEKGVSSRFLDWVEGNHGEKRREEFSLVDVANNEFDKIQMITRILSSTTINQSADRYNKYQNKLWELANA